MPEKKTKLSIYLIKEGLVELADILKNDHETVELDGVGTLCHPRRISP